VTRVGVVVGNPKSQSRTLAVAEAVAVAASGAVGLVAPERVTVDLANVAASLFNWSDTSVRQAHDDICSCALVVIASPVYKASYTGLLKSFLDWFSTTDLDRVVAVPVMVGAAPQHALAVEVHLRPVLVELGALLPTRGLYVLEPQLEELETVIGEWLAVAGPRLKGAVEHRA
jgi:FMN reductase